MSDESSESENDAIKFSKKRKRTTQKKEGSRKKQKIRENAKNLNVEELLAVILENQGLDMHFILSLSGTLIHEGSTKKEMKSAYRKLSKLVHPDKHRSSKKSTNAATKAFQIVASAFEGLTNPKPEDMAPESRKKDSRVSRSNKGCSVTAIHCPRCHSPWMRKLLGLEEASYNFFMSGIKRYVCGVCFMKFGALTGIQKNTLL